MLEHFLLNNITMSYKILLKSMKKGAGDDLNQRRQYIIHAKFKLL